MKSRTIFDYAKNVAGKGDKLEIDDKFSRYMLARYLSFQHPTFALILEKLNRLHTGLTDRMFYDTVFECIPKHYFSFDKYVKKPGAKKKVKHKVVEQMASDLQISQREAEDYLEMVPELKNVWMKMNRVSGVKK